jgi:putative pyruvate formate lyase activating enzyme
LMHRLKEHGHAIIYPRVYQGLDRLSSCTLCPRRCRVDRTRDEKGVCSTGKKAVVAGFSPHFGEEPPLVGHNGSGTLLKLIR